MKRLAQLSSPVALAIGLLSAAASVALAVRGPISGLDLALTVTAVAFVSTTLVGMAVLRTSPANPVGWILLVAGAALPLGMFVQVVSDATYIYGRPAIPGLVVINLVGGVLAVFAVPLVGLASLAQVPVHDSGVGSAVAYGLLLIGMAACAVTLLRTRPEPDSALAFDAFADADADGVTAPTPR